MWVGTFKHGLYFYNAEYHKFEHIKNNMFNVNSINNNNTNCFFEDNNGIWIGTDGGGLNYWNRNSNTFKSYSSKNNKLHTDIVLSLLNTKKDELWVGSWGNGLAIFNTKTKTYKTLTTENSFLLSNNIIAMVMDREGKIWISSLYGGLQIYDPKNNTHENIDLPYSMKGSSVTNSIINIFIDRDDNVWLGSFNHGLIKASKKNAKWNFVACIFLKGMQGENNFYTNTVIQDSKGDILTGTPSGLFMYNKSENTFTNITKSNGYTNLNVISIVEDEKNKLWLATRNGVYSYNSNTKEIIRYDKEDGLQGSVFNTGAFLKTKSNEILFGGSNGFNIFSPDKIKKTKDGPKVFISSLKIFNQSISVKDETKILSKHISQTDSIVLSHQQNNIDLEFNALTFFHPRKVNYAYFLEGFESSWNYVENRQNAIYTNLDPGNYVFRVKSSNSDGVWSDSEKKLYINILQPYWQTLWFKFICAFTIIAFLHLIYKLRTRSIKKQQIVLENKIKERTSQLVKQTKKLKITAEELDLKNKEIQRFTYAVSHDLKSPLSGIKGIAGLIPTEFILEDFPGLQEYLDMINISCDTMSTLIADITKLAKMGKIENKFELLDINYIVALSIKLVEAKIKTKNIKLKIDPLIEIKVNKNENYAIFNIIDNGMGMNQKSLDKLFTPFERFHVDTKGTGLGLYMVKQIIESHNGKINVHSDGENKGATFSIQLPRTQVSVIKKEKTNLEIL